MKLRGSVSPACLWADTFNKPDFQRIKELKALINVIFMKAKWISCIAIVGRSGWWEVVGVTPAPGGWRGEIYQDGGLAGLVNV